MLDSLLVQGGTVVHPSTTERADILVVDGRIAEVAATIEAPSGTVVLDASGCLVGPGLVDLHTHLREPGGEEAETVATGCRAGALGGFTAVVAMPNTSPAIDCAAVVAQVLDLGRAAAIDVQVAGAITVGRSGEKLAPMAEMAALGVRMFTDDGTGVQDAGLMRRAMEYARGIGATVAEHCEDESLAAGGCMNQGALSSKLGLPGRPGLSEEVMVARDLAIAEATGCQLHLLHLSTARSLELVVEARRRGVHVTFEVTPHHLWLTEEECASFDTAFKVHPPLRSASDVAALVTALRSGAIDAVATDHAPHPPQAKDRPFDEASPGMLGLEQAMGLTYEALGAEASVATELFRVLSRTPAAIAYLRSSDERPGGQSAHGGDVVPGEDANLVVFDPEGRTVVDGALLASKAGNTPYEGRTIVGAIRHTICAGHVVVESGEATR